MRVTNAFESVGLALALVAIAMFADACGSDVRSSATTAPSPPPVLFSDRQGAVRDTVFQPLADVKVEILDGPSAGAAAISDDHGRFSLSLPEGRDVRLRATKEGYLPFSWNAPSRMYAGRESCCLDGIHLAPADSQLFIEPGPYTLTLSVDSSCAVIPGDLRTQTFAATVAANPFSSPGLFGVTVKDPNVSSYLNGFRIGVAGNDLAVDEEGELWWHVAPFRYFEVGVGPLQMPVNRSSGSTVSLPFGTYYCELKSAMVSTSNGACCNCFTSPVEQVVVRGGCYSPNNRLTLTPR